MKKYISLITVATCVLLASCTEPALPAGEANPDETLMGNPLFLERYAEELVGSMAEMKIQNDPILEEFGKEGIIDDTRVFWMERVKEARKKQLEGRSGELIAAKEFIKGEVLFLESTLFFSTLFETTPGPELHVYFTTIVDPRDTEFPDNTAIDIGMIKSAYGAQSYSVPELDDPILYRTVVLWDAQLERVYGFAQISER